MLSVSEEAKKSMQNVKHKIIVGSGKGGVGKSTVSVNLAVGLAGEGFKVGILDADINGPSLAKMLAVEEEHIFKDESDKLKPVEKYGVKIASMAFLLQKSDDPVIFRGPLRSSVIKQFIEDINWGELDYLVIDLPPGTGDEALAVTQFIPDPTGFIVVTTPQDLALLDSKKAINFAKKLNIPLLGIIENMSGFICPKCNEHINIFSKDGGKKTALEFNIPFLGAIPLDPVLVQSADNGTPLPKSTQNPQGFFTPLIEQLVQTFSN